LFIAILEWQKIGLLRLWHIHKVLGGFLSLFALSLFKKLSFCGEGKILPLPSRFFSQS
jgi:hypothetical protein